MMPSPDDHDLDQLLARGAPGPARADAIWQKVQNSQPTEQAFAWRKWLAVFAPAVMVFAVAINLYTRHDPEGFVVRGQKNVFAVARCLPDCRPGALLTFELAQTTAGYLHAWANVNNETVWLYPDSTGYAPPVAQQTDLQLVTQGIKIPSHWRGSIDITLVIQPNIDRALSQNSTHAWKTTVRLVVENE